MALSRCRLELDGVLLAAIQARPGCTAPQIGRAVCGRAVRYAQPLARLVSQRRVRTERRLQPDGFVALTYWPVGGAV